MRDKSLSVFSKEWKERFFKEHENKIAEAVLKFEDIPKENVYIRNESDTILQIASSGFGLNVWDERYRPIGGLIDRFKPFIEDYRMVNEDRRVERIAVFDTETTSQFNSNIVSIAIVILNLRTQEIEDEYYTLVNPLESITAEAYRVHKISQAEADKAPTFEDLHETIGSYFAKADVICGQNIETFDLRVMEREYDRIDVINPLLDMPVFDTMHMAKHIVKALDVKGKIKNPTVEEIVEFFNIPTPEGAYHNALVDTKACAEIVKRLFNYTYPEIEE